MVHSCAPEISDSLRPQAAATSSQLSPLCWFLKRPWNLGSELECKARLSRIPDCNVDIVRLPASMPSLRPRSVPTRRTSGPVSLRLVLSLACLAVATWGRWMCRALVQSTMVDPDSGIRKLIGAATWLVLFGPFAALGGYGLMRTWAHYHGVQREQRSAEPVQVLPPMPSTSMQGAQILPEARGPVPPVTMAEPLDEATTLLLDALAARSQAHWHGHRTDVPAFGNHWFRVGVDIHAPLFGVAFFHSL